MKVCATLFILIWTAIANAEGIGAIRSSLEAMESYKAVTKSGYDLRTDIDGNGTADIQNIRNGNEEITLAGDQFQINSYESGNIKIVNGVLEKGHPLVTSVVEGKALSSLGANGVDASYEDICKSITESTKRMEQTSIEFSAGQLANKIGVFFSDECFESDMGVQAYEGDIAKFFRVDKGQSNDTLKCLRNRANEALNLYRSGKIDKTQMLNYHLIFAKAKSEIADFYEGRSNMPLISCEEAQKSSASLTDDGKISIKNGSDGKPADLSAALLQKWGVTESPTEFAKNCKISKPMVVATVSDQTRNQGVGETVLSSTAVKGSTEAKFAPTQVAAVNKQLAQTKVTIPSATEASPKALAKIEATQGPAAVQQVMQQQRSGILNMTNAVMAAVNTQAVAGTKTATRSVASAGSVSGSGSSSSKSSSISGLKKTTIGKNEKIVEEYTVEEPRAGAKTRAVANVGAQGTKSAASLAAGAVGNSRKPANVEEATGGSGELAGGTGGGGGGSSAGGAGRGSSFSPSSGGTKNNSAAAAAGGQGRNTASTSLSNTNDEISGDELVSFIKNSEYASTKLKIQKDNKFRNQLKVNGITIIDKAGNFIVPGDNKVIFMDKGNRFEKQ